MRAVAWFSCGAASTVAAKEAIEKYGANARVVYCDTMATEHPDNARFMADCEMWFGQPVERIRSERYATVDAVFEGTRYMAGIAGARCTVEMKKIPRFAYEEPTDVHIFGLTADEPGRIKRMVAGNPELQFDWILRDGGITKAECLDRLTVAGIALPAMYRLGYDHNNCLGCVKATSPRYWNSIRRDFPEVFARRADQSRRLGARLTRLAGKRIFLDELPIDANDLFVEDLSCGPECRGATEEGTK